MLSTNIAIVEATMATTIIAPLITQITSDSDACYINVSL